MLIWSRNRQYCHFFCTLLQCLIDRITVTTRQKCISQSNEILFYEICLSYVGIGSLFFEKIHQNEHFEAPLLFGDLHISYKFNENIQFHIALVCFEILKNYRKYKITLLSCGNILWFYRILMKIHILDHCNNYWITEQRARNRPHEFGKILFSQNSTFSNYRSQQDKY